MSGHSKWATTKRQKFATDAKRSAVFTKLANMITVAVRTGGGGDPEMNFKLRLAVDKARSASMPKENIERSIKRGLGEGGGANIEEIIYEGLLPLSSVSGAGAAFVLETLTDNRNRAISDIRVAFTKYGGRMVNSGSVLYLFDQVGEIYVLKSSNQLPKDELELIIIDSGAEDYQEDDEGYLVYTHVSDLQKTRLCMEQAGLKVEAAEISYKPKMEIQVSADDQLKIEKLMEALDDIGDVNQMHTNILLK